MKHNFYKDWTQFSRAVKQRNALLRSDTIERSLLDTWDHELASLGENMEISRKEILADFLELYKKKIETLDFIDPEKFGVEYQRGWEEGTPYIDVLKSSFSRDRKFGYTTKGPHKCDLKFAYNKTAVSEIFSRGQLKSLIVAMFDAQIEAFTNSSAVEDKSCILLIDDLPAELDEHNITRLCSWLNEIQSIQIFLTTIEEQAITRFWPIERLKQAKMFHVKHGVVSE